MTFTHRPDTFLIHRGLPRRSSLRLVSLFPLTRHVVEVSASFPTASTEVVAAGVWRIVSRLAAASGLAATITGAVAPR